MSITFIKLLLFLIEGNFIWEKCEMNETWEIFMKEKRRKVEKNEGN